MNRHDADGVSIGFGVVYVVLVGWWLLLKVVDMSLPSVGWFVGAALVAIGALGVFAVLRQRPDRATTGVEPPRPS